MYQTNNSTQLVHSVNTNIVNKPRELFNKVRTTKMGSVEREEAQQEAFQHFLAMEKVYGKGSAIANEAQRLANMAVR